jgi:hypothetical protein
LKIDHHCCRWEVGHKHGFTREHKAWVRAHFMNFCEFCVLLYGNFSTGSYSLMC